MANTIIAGNATNNGLAFSSDSTGVLNILTGSGAGTTALSIDASQNLTVTGSLTVTGNVSGSIKSGTVQTSPPTIPQYFDFIGIPSGVKRITVMFNGVSTSGTSNPLIQLGDAGGVEATGYLGVAVNYSGSGGSNPSTGFGIASASAANLLSGHLVLTNISGNIWIASGLFGTSNTTFATYTAGNKTLSDVLDRIRITTVGGANTFTAGSINIFSE